MSFPLPPILQASLLLFLPESWVFLIVLATPGYNTMLSLLKKICPISFNCDFCDIQSLALIGIVCRWTNNCWSVSKASCAIPALELIRAYESWASRGIVADSHLWMCLCFCVGHLSATDLGHAAWMPHPKTSETRGRSIVPPHGVHKGVDNSPHGFLLLCTDAPP